MWLFFFFLNASDFSVQTVAAHVTEGWGGGALLSEDDKGFGGIQKGGGVKFSP